MACFEVWTGLYVITSVCVVYKLAYLIRQAAALPHISAHLTRLGALFAGTLIAFRMMEAAKGKVVVDPFDVGMQLLWCVILYFVITMLGRRKHVW